MRHVLVCIPFKFPQGRSLQSHRIQLDRQFTWSGKKRPGTDIDQVSELTFV